MCHIVALYFYFFFQAEDGIRDYKVTGVQTCALPIYRAGKNEQPVVRPGRRRPFELPRLGIAEEIEFGEPGGNRLARSEERRVGKESRSRWSPYHLKKIKRKVNIKTTSPLDRTIVHHD